MSILSAGELAEILDRQELERLTASGWRLTDAGGLDPDPTRRRRPRVNVVAPPVHVSRTGPVPDMEGLRAAARRLVADRETNDDEEEN